MRMLKKTTSFICFVFSVAIAQSQTVWFFRDATNPGYYDTGLAFKTPPSTIEQTGPSSDKIPTSEAVVFQGNNSLKMRWTSLNGGDWSALVIAPGFAFQDITTSDSLAFMVYASDGLAKSAMPKLFMECAPGNSKTRKYNLGDYNNDIPANVWTEIRVPLSVFFTDTGNNGIDFTKTKAIILGQNAADGIQHLVYIDNVRTYKGNSSSGSLTAPTNLTASGFDSHTELNWAASSGASGYQIWSNTEGGASTLRKTIEASKFYYLDFVGDLGANLNLKYKVRAISANGQTSGFSNEVSVSTKTMSDSALLTMVQRQTFRYFWENAHPTSGMARERNTSGDIVTIGGTGFGVSAIVVAVERGFITRAEGVNHLLKIVNFLSLSDRFHGIFPHWMDGKTGKTVPFSTYDNGGDLVESSFLFQGLLTAKQYFNGSSTDEARLRLLIQQIWEAAEWNWYRRGGQNVLYWHWSPNHEWRMNFALRGYFEALITYILGVASPTHAIPASIYHQGWAGSPNYRNGQTYYNYKLAVGPLAGGPLFFAHYSFIGFDPRNKKDAYANYFQHNTAQSLVNWTYCKENPKRWQSYSAENWGLTASDDPTGYLAHEPLSTTDNGTISPTAALSSIPYTPEQSIAALKYFYRKEGAKLWGEQGFYDAFNPTQKWYADSYLAIDQGPIICMIENYRTGLLWKYFMQNPEIKPALDGIGFVPDSTTTTITPPSVSEGFNINFYPNPGQDKGFMDVEVKKTDRFSLYLHDMNGRLIENYFDVKELTQGSHTIEIDFKNINDGVYFLILRTSSDTSGREKFEAKKKISIVKK